MVEEDEIHLAIVNIMMSVTDGITMLMKLRSREKDSRQSHRLPAI